MTPFDYFMIFVTIIIALAVESVARDLDVMISAKRRLRWHWMAPATAFNSILLILSQFWLFWSLHAHSPFNNFLIALAPIGTMLVLFLMTSATLPSQIPEAGLDLKQWYFDNCSRFWGLVIALMGCFIVTNTLVFLIHGVSGPQPLIFIGQCVITAAWCASLIWSRAAWWHGTSIVAQIAINLAEFGSLTLR